MTTQLQDRQDLPAEFDANGISALADRDLEPLHQRVALVLERHLREHDPRQGDGLYALVLREVERPLLECVMTHVGGNQSRAAEVLGLNRGTLRKKLKQHGMLHD